VWKGEESAVAIVCFQCDDLDLAFYDSSGKKVRGTGFDFSSNRQRLLALALRAFLLISP